MAERALSTGSSDGAIPAGSTRGSKLISLAALGVVTLHLVERQCSHVHLLPPRRPGDAGVVGRIARLSNDDDEMPVQRLTVNLCNQSVEKIIPVLGYRASACRFERLRWRQDPAYRDGGARCVGEAKRIEAMERAIVNPDENGWLLIIVSAFALSG